MTQAILNENNNTISMWTVQSLNEQEINFEYELKKELFSMKKQERLGDSIKPEC